MPEPKTSYENRQPEKVNGYHAPGQVARNSGIYEIIHEGHTGSMQKALVVKGDVFLPCTRCDDRVRYRLLEAAPRITEDEDFQPRS